MIRRRSALVIVPRRQTVTIAMGMMVIMIAIVAAVARPVRAEPPVAPGPETVMLDARVAPAAFIAEPDGAGQGSRPGPVPLGPGAAAGPQRSIRPLPDWRLLAAMGAAFAALAGYRLFTNRRTVTLPPDVFEVLGEAALGGQQSVRVVRFGPRTLLVGVSSAGCQTLAELTDPQATDCIVAACRGTGIRGAPPAAARGQARAAARGTGSSTAEARA